MPHKMCPVWLGHFIASPLRRLLHSPEKILAGMLQPGMTALDLGPGMGFFSVPMARMVGAGGKIICVDNQPGMLAGLRKRAVRAGVAGQIETRLCDQNSLGLEGQAATADFALAFAMVHEVPDAAKLFAETASALKQGAKLLVAEPRGHVTEESFAKTVFLAEASGFRELDRPKIRSSRAIVLEKK